MELGNNTETNWSQQGVGRRRFGFVVPRFGESIVGGAETLIGALAQKLAARGDQVEVLTTCARDNRSWENHFLPGRAVEFGVPVIRFPVDTRNLDLWIPRQISIAEGFQIGMAEELAWLEQGVNSRALYHYIAQHAKRFDALFFGPYLFPTTLLGAMVAPERSVLIPCLHDESYAYTAVVGKVFRTVKKALFNAAAEQQLAYRLFGELQGGVVGMGFDYPHTDRDLPSPAHEPVNVVRERIGVAPYLLYLGRKETGKNAHLLIDCFQAYKARCKSDLKLVILGGGSFDDLLRPNAKRDPDIIDLQQVSEEEKRVLLRDAFLLCQPSCNESFSIVLMEAWLERRPVLVHARCPVTRQHAVDAGGGLYFDSTEDFIAVLSHLENHPGLDQKLGAAGFQYVRTQYEWGAVLKRFDAALAAMAWER